MGDRVFYVSLGHFSVDWFDSQSKGCGAGTGWETWTREKAIAGREKKRKENEGGGVSSSRVVLGLLPPTPATFFFIVIVLFIAIGSVYNWLICYFSEDQGNMVKKKFSTVNCAMYDEETHSIFQNHGIAWIVLSLC